MSVTSLRTRIEEEHLTCTICFGVFKTPKALPCLHTFCEGCLRGYVVSRGFEENSSFPCPICRIDTPIPPGGLKDFPDNYWVNSLSDTVESSSNKPKPMPRRSLQPKVGELTSSVASPPPPYSAVVQDPNTLSHFQSTHGDQISQGQSSCAPDHQNQALDFVPPYSYTQSIASENVSDFVLKPVAATPSPSVYPSGPLYPAIPLAPQDVSSIACSEGLILRFGKKGFTLKDFHKPFGLAVSSNSEFVVTDLGGNRIFIFSNGGEAVKAFSSDCRIKDVAVTTKNQILVVVNKPGAGFRCYDMSGRCLSEHGKFLSYEETHGITALQNGGAALTGIKNQVVYVLTDQFKLTEKFGRKGCGDGYFQSPAFVTTDSKSHIIVSDNVNHNIQVFTSNGKFKLRFGGQGSGPGQLNEPMGICTDHEDNIIVADSSNYRVEVFSPRGRYMCSIVTQTNRLGENVRPINVAFTPQRSVAVLLEGPYFAEVRVFSLRSISHGSASVKDSSVWYLVN